MASRSGITCESQSYARVLLLDDLCKHGRRYLKSTAPLVLPRQGERQPSQTMPTGCIHVSGSRALQDITQPIIEV